MGVVDLVRDHRRGELVALKTLTTVEHDNLFRFKREFRSLAGIEHPNLARLHELIAFGGEWHLVMEHVDGVDLLSHLCEEPGAARLRDMPTAPLAKCDVRPAPPLGCYYEDEQMLRVCFRQLALGLHGLHQAGWLHRDLKPANVLVTRSGRVVLLDFGLVTERVATATRSALDDHALGTPAYMAPEQAAGEPATVASDWYAFGVMLYEALTGQWPFDGSVLDILVHKQGRRPRPVRALNADAPEDLERLCLGLLSRSPAERLVGAEVIRLCAPGETFFTSRATRWPHRSGALARQQCRLEQALSSLSPGRPMVACIQGPARSGKSELGARFAAAASHAGTAIVLSGRCLPGETLPMKGVDDLVDSLAGYLRRIRKSDVRAAVPRHIAALCDTFPVLRGVPALRPWEATRTAITGPTRAAAGEALLHCLRFMARCQPLVLWVDDVHLSDVDSHGLLARLFDAPADLCLMLVVSRTASAPGIFVHEVANATQAAERLRGCDGGKGSARGRLVCGTEGDGVPSGVSARVGVGPRHAQRPDGSPLGGAGMGGRASQLLRLPRDGGVQRRSAEGGPAAGFEPWPRA